MADQLVDVADGEGSVKEVISPSMILVPGLQVTGDQWQQGPVPAQADEPDPGEHQPPELLRPDLPRPDLPAAEAPAGKPSPLHP